MASTYFGGSLEVQFPICGLPRDLGLKGAVFADAGTLFGYKGPTVFDTNGNGFIDGYAPTGCSVSQAIAQECIIVRDSKLIRSSVGASILWTSPLGPIRFDYAIALSQGRRPRGTQRRQVRRRQDAGLPLLGRNALLIRRGRPTAPSRHMHE